MLRAHQRHLQRPSCVFVLRNHAHHQCDQGGPEQREDERAHERSPIPQTVQQFLVKDHPGEPKIHGVSREGCSARATKASSRVAVPV